MVTSSEPFSFLKKKAGAGVQAAPEEVEEGGIRNLPPRPNRK